MKTINDKDTVWHRAQAGGLHDALFVRAATRCEEFDLGFGPAPCAVPPDGYDENWHLVRWIKDDDGRPAVLWRLLRFADELVP
jgi:hypothetical protein